MHREVGQEDAYVECLHAWSIIAILAGGFGSPLLELPVPDFVGFSVGIHTGYSHTHPCVCAVGGPVPVFYPLFFVSSFFCFLFAGRKERTQVHRASAAAACKGRVRV